ncbi:MAG: hypothetical protein ABIJ12_06265 [bacterium]
MVTTIQRPFYVAEGEQWSGDETQEQYEKAGKKLAEGVASVLPSAPVQRYGDPHKPSGDVLDAGAEGDYISGLDITAPTEEEQQSIKDKVAKQFQAQIDAVDAYYNELAAQEQARGAQRLATGLGKVKSVQARSGLLDTPMGEAQRVAEERGQQEYTAGNVKLLKAEQDLKKTAVLDKIDTRAQQTIDAQKAEAEANYTKAEAYKTKVRNEARSDIDTLAQTTALDVFKANKDLYEQLKFEGGFGSDLEFDTYYESKAKSGATKLTSDYKGTNGNQWTKVTLLYPNGKTVTNDYDLGIPYDSSVDYDHQITPDGTMLLIPKKFKTNDPQSEIKIYGSEGQFAKPTEPTGQVVSGGFTTTKTQIGELGTALKQKAGSDGYVNTADYLQGLQNWINAKGLAKDYYSNFLPKDYLNPADPTIPQNIKNLLKYDEVQALINALGE